VKELAGPILIQSSDRFGRSGTVRGIIGAEMTHTLKRELEHHVQHERAPYRVC